MPALKPTRYHPLSPTGIAYLTSRSVWRFFITGRTLSDRKTDNASFLHAATKDERGKPVERLTGPLWQRVVIRWAVIGTPLLFLFFAGLGYPVRWIFEQLDRPTPTFFTLPWVMLAIGWEIVVLVSLVWLGGSMALTWWKNREQLAEFVRPAWEASCLIMGAAYHRRDARQHVELPEGFRVTDARETDEPSRLTRLAGRLPAIRKRLDRRAVEAAERAAAQPAEGGTETPPTDAVDVRRSLLPAVWRRGGPVTGVLDAPVETPEPAPVRIFLLPGRITTEQDRKRFAVAVGSTLGMPDCAARWYGKGRKPFVELRPNLAPPPAVSFEQIRKHLVKAPVTAPFMGLAPGNHPVSIDLDNNSPHTLISGGSGTGKSVMLKNFIAQRMHHGVGVLMLDYKRVSHRWLHNLPGCVYAWRLAEVHAALCAAGEELGRRLETVLPEDNDVNAEMKVFDTIDIIVEEINSTTKLLAAYWNTVLDGKGTSPAITALMTLVNMGREYHMHVWIAAQRASASVFGNNGGDLRESFQTRLMAKWSVQTWKMLAGNAQYRRPVGGRGVWARVQDDEVEIVRVPFWTNTEAREWAMSGEPCPVDILPGGAYASGGVPRIETADIGPQLVALSAALPHLPADKRGKSLTVEGLRSAAKRSPGFPAPRVVGSPPNPSLYDLDALIEWRMKQVGVGELNEMFEQPAKPSQARRPGIVYACDTLNPETGAIELGYVGQTRRTLAQRETEHRGDKPWSDLIVGSFRVIWSGEPTDSELDTIELQHIRELFPRYNIEGQKGKRHAVPKWTQLEQRHERDHNLGRPEWVPIDVFNGERRPELVEEWRRDAIETSRED
jgi:hypothetical protein